MARNFKYTTYKPSKFEKTRRSHLETRLQAMSTPYRRSLIEMAELGRLATEGAVTDEDRVSNSELLKIPISHAVIMQRVSTLADNPSEAIYRTTNKDKNRLNIMNQINVHDKIEGSYEASYLTFMMTAEREGICFVQQGWHEDVKLMGEEGNKPVTIGKMFTSQEEVRIENIWWDPRANHLRGYKGIVANDVITRTFDSVEGLRIRLGNNKNYKNITSVKPMEAADAFYHSNIFNERWYASGDKRQQEDWRGEVQRSPGVDISMEVTIWSYYARNYFEEETGAITDKMFEYANGVEIRNTALPVPKVKGSPILPFTKFVAIPTSGMGGISMPALIRHPEKALHRMITMADSQAELAINPIQFVSSSIMDTLENSPIGAGSRVEVAMQGRSVADELYFHNAPDITQGAQYIIDKMLQLITMVTGVDINILFESPRTKAISTERKREIQEKLLRFSVIYNEAHGFFDLEELRLHIMLENYPVKRFFLDRTEDGKEMIVQRYPYLPVNGYQVKIEEGDEGKSDDDKKYEIQKSAKAFNLLVINPASIEYNVHLYIQGATNAANEDTFKLNKGIEKLNLLSTNPWTMQVIDPIKGARKVFEVLNLDEDELIQEQLEKSHTELHGATKEIQALLISDVKPIEIKIDEDYNAEEYVNVFTNFMQLPEFKALSESVQQKMIERFNLHLMNNLNPYYKEQMQAEKEAAEAAAAQAAQAPESAGPTAVNNAEAAMDPIADPMELTKSVNSKAGELGKTGKTSTQLGNEK